MQLRWAACALVLSIVGAACGGQVFATTPPEPPSRETKIGLQISGFRASNGLHIVLVPDPNAREVQVTMRYHTGAVDDPVGQEGMAHLVEHLMFLQVAQSESVFARLERIATYFNGETRLDTTTYVERAPAGKLADLLATETLRGTTPCLSIGDDAFRREREVVVNELAQKAGAFALVHAIDDAAYPEGHPYHRAPDTAATVRAITREQACAFAARHYGPANAVLVVSGNATAAAMRGAVMAMLALPAATADHPLDPPHEVPPLVPHGEQHVTRTAPVKQRALIIAWPLPLDPGPRAIAMALAAELGEEVDALRSGNSELLQLGGDRSPLVAIGIELGPADTAAGAIADVTKALAALDHQHSSLPFERARQQAIHALFASFEDGEARDIRLAQHVEAGREAGDGFSREVQAVANVTVAMAHDIGADVFAPDRATIVEIQPEAKTAAADLAAVAAPIHDAGQPRAAVDPAEAHRPVPASAAPDPFARAVERRLANGLRVVLLPASSVPAIEIRLLVGAGRSDEPSAQKGLADLAARAIDGDLTRADLAWLIPFYEAGGEFDVHVGIDQTVFAVDGSDRYIDYLLAGLGKMIRVADESAIDTELAAAREKATGTAAALAAPDRAKAMRADRMWRASLFGVDHPYARIAGAFELGAIDGAAVVKFHEAHIAPDAATLVVAGGFDVDAAVRWIDYVFGDWRGHSVARAAPAPKFQRVSIAAATDSPHVGVALILPATAAADPSARAAELVAVAMAGELLGDIRFQLGASYGFHAHVEALRLARYLDVTGSIDAARGVEAIQLIRDRFAQLKAAAGGHVDDALASAFVRARARVIAQLRAYQSGSTALADRVERLTALGEDLHAEAKLADAAAALTVDQMGAALAELDLDRASLELDGPRAVVAAMFQALGRTPTFTD